MQSTKKKSAPATQSRKIKATQPVTVKKGTAVKSTRGNKKSVGEASKVKPNKRVWTKEDDAAKKIQAIFQIYKAKNILKRKRQEKQEYEDVMDRLEKEAFLKMVRLQQEEAERERKLEEEERRRKAEQRKRIKRVLESAFDGDNDEILTILKEVSELDDANGVEKGEMGCLIREKHQLEVIDCEDANGNTPLSEAANGGCVETIRLLIELGGNINSQGQFKRTPLYRAAFAGHLEACQVLLQNGADPRIYAADGQTPEQVASVRSVTEFLANWQISQTEVLQAKLEAEKQRRADAGHRLSEARKTRMEQQTDMVQKEYETQQKKLEKAYLELNKRIEEHDTALSNGFERPELTLQSIHDAEMEVEVLKLEFDKVQEKLAQAKIKLQEEKNKHQDASNLPGVKVLIRELDEVLMRDVGNKIRDSDRWPLLIDTSEQTSIFLRYRDTNYMNALRPADMNADNMRLALLGAIRYGKPAVLDMMELDMFNTVCERMEEIIPGLMASLMDKSILHEQRYLKLVKDTDGDEYSKTKFNDLRAKQFRFFLITKNPFPPLSLMEQTYPIRVYISS